jgi:hypothetical protein
MARVEENRDREERITGEIIADAYDAEEQAMGWYYYLEQALDFPFQARCIAERRTSPLRVGEEVQALGLLPEGECLHEMFVEIEWEGRSLGVPLAQLEAVAPDAQTREAIADWHYWMARGYVF